MYLLFCITYFIIYADLLFDDTIPYIIYHPGSVRQVLFLENQNTPDVIPGHELVVYIVKVDT
mgnify:CR=1 FL=1